MESILNTNFKDVSSGPGSFLISRAAQVTRTFWDFCCLAFPLKWGQASLLWHWWCDGEDQVKLCGGKLVPMNSLTMGFSFLYYWSNIFWNNIVTQLADLKGQWSSLNFLSQTQTLHVCVTSCPLNRRYMMGLTIRGWGVVRRNPWKGRWHGS